MSLEQKARPSIGHQAPTLRRLHLLARIAWGVLAAVTIGLFVASTPAYFSSLHLSCTPAACETMWQLTPHVLREASKTLVDFYAASIVAFALVLACGYIAIGTVIFWHRPGDLMALLTSFWLVTFACYLNDTMLKMLAPAWGWLITGLGFLSVVCFYLVFYLFPSGHFAPRWARWLWVGVIVYYGAVLFFPDFSLNPVAPSSPLNPLLFLGCIGSLLATQIYRYRRVSSRVERQQTKWVLFGLFVALTGIAGLALLTVIAPSLREQLLFMLIYATAFDGFALLIPLSFAFAILRSRLWDIDIVINRTLVYGALTVCVLGIYTLVIGGLGTLLQARGNLMISLLTTGLIAVLFQPLRTRFQRTINRLMYGERDDPYQVISRLGQRLEAVLVPEAVLPAVVDVVAQTLKLPYVALTLKQGDELVLVASHGTAPEAVVHVPLISQSEQVGELVLATRTPGEAFTPAERRLLEDLARQAGVAAHAVQLTEDLKRLTVDLQRSRERLVTAREEERRRLRRDLHDGLGPQLASLTLKLETARNRLGHDPLAETLLADLTVQTQSAVADIRRLVYGLRPPVLDELGLVAALREQAVQYTSGPSIRFDVPDSLPELAAAVEVAAYRIALEALTNVVRHARACSCTIRLELDEAAETLTVEVRDDGQGWLRDRQRGVGLTSMRERAEELGGWVVLEPVPTGGLVVRAQLPCVLSSPSPVSERPLSSPSWQEA